MVLVLMYTIQCHVSEEQLLSRMKQIGVKSDVLERMVDETLNDQDLVLYEQNADTPEKV